MYIFMATVRGHENKTILYDVEKKFEALWALV
jgi:hypothetical protein